MYRSGTDWYYRYDGRWYRGTNYSGPFTYVGTSSVPRAVRTVPAKYRHHWTSASTTSTTVSGTRSASHSRARVKSRHKARTTGYSHRTTSTSMGSTSSSYDNSHSSAMDNSSGSMTGGSMSGTGSNMGTTGTTTTVTAGQPYSGPAISFTTTPVIAVIPGTQVSYIRNSDYDMYRVGTDWYMNYNGTWYRGTSYSGPFITVETTTVPHSIMVIPT
jgi:hypothetical protein